MVFYLIGLGLGDPRDVTVRGLEVIKCCERVYLEAYTSILSGGRDALVSSTFYIHYMLCITICFDFVPN